MSEIQEPSGLQWLLRPRYEYRAKLWGSDDPWSEYRPVIGTMTIRQGSVTINGLTFDGEWAVDVRQVKRP
jgi:hypothetical protein